MKPKDLALKHWRDEGSFRNPYPCNSEPFRDYEEQAIQILMDEEFKNEDCGDEENN